MSSFIKPRINYFCELLLIFYTTDLTKICLTFYRHVSTFFFLIFNFVFHKGSHTGLEGHREYDDNFWVTSLFKCFYGFRIIFEISKYIFHRREEVRCVCHNHFRQRT